VASWGEADDIERFAALIDRLASRIEDAVLVDPGPAPAASPVPLAA
jgi:hypothetical protein